MRDLRIELERGAAFEPGAEIRGQAAWDFDAGGARHVSLRLFWFTQGKGTEDLTVVQRLELATGRPADRVPFTLVLPAGPYSFSGRLVSLRWALELVADDEQTAARTDIVMAPGGTEVRIDGGPA